MPKRAKNFELTLDDEEAAEIHNPPVSSKGGRQQHERQLYKQLQKTPNKLIFDDAGLGKAIRYMGQYDGDKPSSTGGGYQGRLRRAIGRAIGEKIGIKAAEKS